MYNSDDKKIEAYNNAYKYLKSYKSPHWGLTYLFFYRKGDYDTAIEMAKNDKSLRGIINYSFISTCYIIKGDMQNAELYIDKSIKNGEKYYNLAQKAYILKETGRVKESLVYYEKAK